MVVVVVVLLLVARRGNRYPTVRRASDAARIGRVRGRGWAAACARALCI